MIRLLFRLIVLCLCAVLVASAVETYLHTQPAVHGHDTIYVVHWPWLREARLWSLFAVLAACLLIAKSDPLFTRISLLAVIVSLAIVLLPPREVHHTLEELHDIKLQPPR